MSKIDRKGIIIKSTLNDVEYTCYIPFLQYIVFKDLTLIFSQIYTLFVGNKINPLTFTQDYKAWVDNILNDEIFKNNKEDLQDKFNNFIDTSLSGAVIYDTQDNYNIVNFREFLEKNKEEEEISDFYNDIVGLYVFFYPMSRYVRKKDFQNLFKDIITSLSIMEFQNSFMNCLSQENFTNSQKIVLQNKTS